MTYKKIYYNTRPCIVEQTKEGNHIPVFYLDQWWVFPSIIAVFLITLIMVFFLTTAIFSVMSLFIGVGVGLFISAIYTGFFWSYIFHLII